MGRRRAAIRHYANLREPSFNLRLKLYLTRAAPPRGDPRSGHSGAWDIALLNFDIDTSMKLDGRISGLCSEAPSLSDYCVYITIHSINVKIEKLYHLPLIYFSPDPVVRPEVGGLLPGLARLVGAAVGPRVHVARRRGVVTPATVREAPCVPL